MDIIPYFIHPDVIRIIELYNLDVFNMDNYIFDNIHENHKYLQSLDPRDWKEQDHYSVLRLSKVRFHASQDLIKQAYRKQLLNHHPDKGKQRLMKCSDESNDYFTCITRAYDLLKDQSSRISYDSVDPQFDDLIPTLQETKEQFFQSLGPVFQRNSRWSKIQPVPLLGNDTTDIADVYKFYDFWDEFQTWREFSYLDEESKHQAESRDERRYIDKLNKAERKKKSQEEAKRINALVQLAKQNDPRIIRYNEKRKADKEAEKKAKTNKKLELRLAAERILNEEREKQEQEELERQLKLKEELNNLKKQKELLKNKQKSEKRKLRKIVESYNYFDNVLSKYNNNSPKSMDLQKAEIMNIIEMICLKLSVDELVILNEKLDNANEDEMMAIIKITEETISGKLSDNVKISKKDTNLNSDSPTVNKCGNVEWNFELNQLLIKAINSHPPGTIHRWHVIAEYMNQHCAGLNIKEKQAIERAKIIKTNDTQIKQEALNHNFTQKVNQNIENTLKNVRITDRQEQVISPVWSIEEQKLLEKALKSVANNDPSRWDKISECVGTRSKKECILRFKECVEKMKAKKIAQ